MVNPNWAELGTVIRDPGLRYKATKDNALWLTLLRKAREIDDDFYYRLCWMRDVGCVLVMDSRFGYRLEPIIGFNNWSSRQEWNKEKQCLRKYQRQLIEILKELR